MPDPMTPDPRTATFLIFLILFDGVSEGEGRSARLCGVERAGAGKVPAQRIFARSAKIKISSNVEQRKCPQAESRGRGLGAGTGEGMLGKNYYSGAAIRV
ncbi:MAG: hypothetical protein D6765_16000 [Bacteroidetes bacterium]|nr:MAG: hypothetical protein D6765_16000 [Bacteroidota bacterium]